MRGPRAGLAACGATARPPEDHEPGGQGPALEQPWPGAALSPRGPRPTRQLGQSSRGPARLRAPTAWASHASLERSGSTPWLVGGRPASPSTRLGLPRPTATAHPGAPELAARVQATRGGPVPLLALARHPLRPSHQSPPTAARPARRPAMPRHPGLARAITVACRPTDASWPLSVDGVVGGSRPWCPPHPGCCGHGPHLPASLAATALASSAAPMAAAPQWWAWAWWLADLLLTAILGASTTTLRAWPAATGLPLGRCAPRPVPQRAARRPVSSARTLAPRAPGDRQARAHRDRRVVK
jgi:hypothetical protein